MGTFNKQRNVYVIIKFITFVFSCCFTSIKIDKKSVQVRQTEGIFSMSLVLFSYFINYFFVKAVNYFHKKS